MDGDRFDALTRRLAGAATRRQLVKGLGGGLAAGLLGRRPVGAAETKTIRCKLKRKYEAPTGEKGTLSCEVECPREASYCVTCGESSTEPVGAFCQARCCSGPDCDPPPTKEQVKEQCQKGRVVVKP